MAFRNKSVNAHSFAMIPRSDVPRSGFPVNTGLKTCFNSGYLVPIFVDEVLPGDTFNIHHTIFGRLATPIFPVMDNLFLDTFYFFVPNRLLWDNWQRFMGEQDNPDDSIDYLVPQIEANGGLPVGGIYDHFGIPVDGQVTGPDTYSFNALPFRAYNLIWRDWFRDENLQDTVGITKGDGPDAPGTYQLLKRGKRKDYFTSCLPWAQKGEPVSIPLGNDVRVVTGTAFDTTGLPPWTMGSTTGAGPGSLQAVTLNSGNQVQNGSATALANGGVNLVPNNLYADLSEATAATINSLRQAFQIQKLLEKDARGGTRYKEVIYNHFGVISPDARLDRPEYLGGGSTRISINPVAQTSGGDPSTETPQGNLAAFGSVLATNGFSQSFTEHGYIIGLANVRADLTYQQGIRKLFSRRTRYDFYWPVFQALGEQAVLNKEIYFTGNNGQDHEVFGYQERWGEYRYHPSEIHSLMRSTAAGTIDAWHLSQNFSALPVLNSDFISENPPLQRVLAVGSEANGQEIICDIFFSGKKVRPIPMFSVPGMIDHF